MMLLSWCLLNLFIFAGDVLPMLSNRTITQRFFDLNPLLLFALPAMNISTMEWRSFLPKVLKILLHWSHTNDRPSFIISSQVLCPCTLVSSLSDRAINPVGIINGMEIVPVGLYVKPGRDNTQNTPAKTCINPVGTRPNYWVHTCCLHRKKL